MDYHLLRRLLRSEVPGNQEEAHLPDHPGPGAGLGVRRLPDVDQGLREPHRGGREADGLLPFVDREGHPRGRAVERVGALDVESRPPLVTEADVRGDGPRGQLGQRDEVVQEGRLQDHVAGRGRAGPGGKARGPGRRGGRQRGPRPRRGAGPPCRGLPGAQSRGFAPILVFVFRAPPPILVFGPKAAAAVRL